jgi:hypothetical protein
MPETIANKINQIPLLKHLYFLACAFTSILLVGYFFGTFDQAIHIPFLKASVDGALFPGDAFIALRDTHYSYFWYFFQPFLQAGILEIAMFALHVLATYLTFWALWNLSLTLFQDALAAFLGTLAFVPLHIFFAGFPIIEFSLLNRTFVLPFILLALNLYLRGRVVPAFLLLGILYNLHVVSVNFAMAMLLFASVIEIKKIGWRSLALGLILFVLAALPVLSWKAHSTPLDLSLRPDWLAVLINGQLLHLFHLFGPSLYAFAIGVSSLSSLALFFIAWYELYAPPASGLSGLGRRAWHNLRRYLRAEEPSPARTGILFVLALILVVCVEEISSHFLPATILVQSQIIRAGVIASLLAYLYFARYLALVYRRPAREAVTYGIQAAAFIAGPMAFWPVLTWALFRWLPISPRRRSLIGGTLVTTIALTLALGVYLNIWQPGIFLFGPKNAWQATQEWARDHTPKDALFITPPEIWWMYESDWRTFSERSTVATLSELLETAFAPDYTKIWQTRFEAVAPGAQAQFRGDFLTNIQTTRSAYYRMSSAQVLSAACQYGASYFVVENAYTHPFAAVYENSQYRVYQIPLGECQN